MVCFAMDPSPREFVAIRDTNERRQHIVLLCSKNKRACRLRAQRLKEMDIEIIEDGGGGKDFSHVKEEDVVILPAFGASVQEMRLLNDKGVRIVDTTCPWVAKVQAACCLGTTALVIELCYVKRCAAQRVRTV